MLSSVMPLMFKAIEFTQERMSSWTICVLLPSSHGRAGHNERLKFKVMEEVVENPSKQRSRDVSWFNSP
jgi:hypothetical protein